MKVSLKDPNKLNFDLNVALSSFVVFIAVLTFVTSCRKALESPSEEFNPEVLISTKIGDYSDHSSNILKLDLDHHLCVINQNSIRYFPKTEGGVQHHIEQLNISHAVVNEEDTIFLADNKFIRFYPSSMEMELIFSVNSGLVFDFCVTPGHGIGYVRTSFLVDYFNYFEFQSTYNKTLFEIRNFLPDLAMPIRNYHTVMKNQNPHLIVSANRVDSFINYNRYLYDINLKDLSIHNKNPISYLASFFIRDIQDGNLLTTSAFNLLEQDRKELSLYSIAGNKFISTYHFDANFFRTSHTINGEYLCHVTRGGIYKDDIIYLVHWPSKNKILDFTKKYSGESPRVANIEEDAIIWYSRDLTYGLIYDKNGIPNIKMISDYKFRDILAATKQYIIILTETGNVEMFKLM